MPNKLFLHALSTYFVIQSSTRQRWSNGVTEAFSEVKLIQKIEQFVRALLNELKSMTEEKR